MASKTKNSTRGLVKNLLRSNLKRAQTLEEIDELVDDIDLHEHLADSGMFPELESDTHPDGLTLRNC